MFNHIKQSTQQLISLSHQPSTPGSKPKVLLGLSGGPDSVFLLHVLKILADENNIELCAAHLDHEWRANSHEDAIFCQELCNRLEVKIYVEQTRNLELSHKPNGSQEELGRKMRRAFFETIAQEHAINFIALAHHLQDQQETFFMRLIRGTTLDGLTCMKPVDGLYVRPLLNINKQDMLQHLDNQNISYLHDPTNLSDDYLRNRIRKYVLPALNSCDERFDKKFETTIQSLREENDFLGNLVHDIFINIFTFDQTHQRFLGNLAAFRAFDLVLKKRVIVWWLIQEKVSFSPSTGHIEEILRFLMSPHGGSHQLGTAWQLCKQQKLFWIEKFSD